MSELTTNLNNILSIKGDIKTAIESKGVDMTGVSFPDYANKIGEIPVGGTMGQLSVLSNGTYTPPTGIDGWDRVTVDVPQSVTGFTEKEITEGVQIVNLNNSASSVHPFTFAGNSYLQTVNLPNCTIVNELAFASCNNLTTVNLPVCESLGTTTYGNMSVFIGCGNLTNISIPVCKYVAPYTFNDCKKLVSFYGPSVSIIGQKCFEGCYSLNSVYIPLCSQIDGSAFRYCSALTSIDLPEVNWLGALVFKGCINLSYINIPQISSVQTSLFQNCTSLTTVMIGSMSSSVIPLGNSNAFTGTPIAAGTGSIYVPTSLVDAYKSAKNWSAFSSQIFPIE